MTAIQEGGEAGPDGKGVGGTRLILASRSPRRRQLLETHGIAHEAIHPGIEDADLDPGCGRHGGPVEAGVWVAALAYLKAAAGMLLIPPDPGDGEVCVIGADTACIKDGALIGTPEDAAEAERIIRLLDNGEHEVVTGVAVITRGPDRTVRRRALFVDRAGVRVGRIGEDRIRAYIASGQWEGKAGAYNLVERIRGGWPIEYDGDPATVMGLPVTKLAQVLRRINPSMAC